VSIKVPRRKDPLGSAFRVARRHKAPIAVRDKWRPKIRVHAFAGNADLRLAQSSLRAPASFNDRSKPTAPSEIVTVPTAVSHADRTTSSVPRKRSLAAFLAVRILTKVQPNVVICVSQHADTPKQDSAAGWSLLGRYWRQLTGDGETIRNMATGTAAEG
jgi:hypothetical protein